MGQALFSPDSSALLTRDEARQRTDRLKARLTEDWQEFVALWRGGAHLALGYGSWGDYFEAEFDRDGKYGYRLLEHARVMEMLGDSPIGESPSISLTESQAREFFPLRKDPELLREAWHEVESRFGSEPTAANIRQVVQEKKLGFSVPAEVAERNDFFCENCGDWFPTPVWECRQCQSHWSQEYDERCKNCYRSRDGTEEETGEEDESPEPIPLAVHFSSESAEWYTPQHIIERVCDVLGGIDLDPCSNSHEHPNVPAAEHYTAADDGLSKDWRGTVYMNPPYGRDIEPWAQKLAQEFAAGRTTEAIALVPARTDTQWFRILAGFPVCFLDGRLKFSGHENSAPFPSALFYLGWDVAKFGVAFEDIGLIYQRWSR